MGSNTPAQSGTTQSVVARRREGFPASGVLEESLWATEKDIETITNINTFEGKITRFASGLLQWNTDREDREHRSRRAGGEGGSRRLTRGRGALPSKDLKKCYQRQGAAKIIPPNQ